MTPLAIGQERSIRLVDEARRQRPDDRARHRTLVRGGGRERRRPLRDRHLRGHPQDDPGPRRDAPHPRPGRRPHPAGLGRADRAVLDRTLHPAPRRRRGGQGGGGARALGRGALRADHLDRALPPRGAAPRRRQRRDAERPRQPDRYDDPPEDGGEAGAARDRRRRGAAAQADGDPLPRAGGVRARDEDPVAGPGGDGQDAARVVPPPAAEGDPGGAGRVRRTAGGDHGAAGTGRRGEPPRGSRQAGAARARPALEATARRRRVRRHPHLPRVDPFAPVERDDRRRPRPQGRQAHPGRGSLRPRQGQGAHRRAPRSAEADEHALGPHPLLRRPTRRRQDLARPVDRTRARAQVRARVGRRRPRRGGDPRPPAHVHRRDARDDHPRACAMPAPRTRSS